MKHLLVIACLCVAILGVSQTPNNKGTAKQSGTSQPSATAKAQQRTASPPPTEIVAISSQQIKSPENKGKAGHSGEDIEIQRQLAKFTKYLVLVGIVQAVVFAWTLLAIRRQAEIMEKHADHLKDLVTAASNNATAAKASADALKSAERAWILAKPYLPDKLRPVGENRVTRFMWSIKSVGRTPARIIETDAVVGRVADLKTIPQQPRYEGDRPMSLNNLLLVPSDSIPIYWMIEPAGQGLTVEEVARIRDGTLTLFAYGFVKYLDVYAEVHTTRFCHTYFIPQGGDSTEEGFYPYLFAPVAYTECD